jgi:hypothetical protein
MHGSIPVAGDHTDIATRETKILYAVAYEFVDRKTGEVIPQIEYMHALDEPNARFQFHAGHRWPEVGRIVSVGPVVGRFVDDKDGKRLSL